MQRLGQNDSANGALPAPVGNRDGSVRCRHIPIAHAGRSKPTDGDRRLRLQSGQSAHADLCAGQRLLLPGPRGGSPWLHADGRRLRSRLGLVRAGRSLRLRPALCRAAGGQQSQALLQLVSARRHRTRPRRDAFDPPDGRACRSTAWRRQQPHLRHRPFRRRSDDIDHAGDLSGGVRRRRHRRRPALSLRHQRSGSLRMHVPGTDAVGSRMGRSGAQCVARIAARGRKSPCGTAAPMPRSSP